MGIKSYRDYKINLKVDESILHGSSLNYNDIEIHLNKSLIEYLHENKGNVFSLAELDEICETICNELLDKDDNDLYSNISKIIDISLEEFRGEYSSLLCSVYIHKLGDVQCKNYMKKFVSGIHLYKPIIINSILHNKKISKRVGDYINDITEEMYKISNAIFYNSENNILPFVKNMENEVTDVNEISRSLDDTPDELSESLDFDACNDSLFDSNNESLENFTGFILDNSTSLTDEEDK